jgi:hypothetical protein
MKKIAKVVTAWFFRQGFVGKMEAGMIETICCELHGIRVLECGAEGPRLSNDGMVMEMIGEAWSHKSSLIVIPVSRLGEDFFQLKTRVAGEMLQKFVTYNLRVAIVGDIGSKLAESSALHDFVVECNRGSHIWFVDSLEKLGERLKLHESNS